MPYIWHRPKLADPPRADSPRIAALRSASLPAETWCALFLALATHVEKLAKPAPQRVELVLDYAETIVSRSTNMLPRSAALGEQQRLLEEVQQLDLGRGVIKSGVDPHELYIRFRHFRDALVEVRGQAVTARQRLRDAKEMKLDELAAAARVPATAVMAFEAGTPLPQDFTAPMTRRLAKALDVDTTEFRRLHEAPSDDDYGKALQSTWKHAIALGGGTSRPIPPPMVWAARTLPAVDAAYRLLSSATGLEEDSIRARFYELGLKDGDLVESLIALAGPRDNRRGRPARSGRESTILTNDWRAAAATVAAPLPRSKGPARRK
jgi:transcriptional regulator with XRE-family HTH domain